MPELWQSMGLLGRALVLLQAAMLAYVLLIIRNRLMRFSAVRRISGEFVRAVNPAFMSGNLNLATRIAEDFSCSHIARVIQAVLVNFTSFPSSIDDKGVLHATANAAQRSQAIVHCELRRGLPTLALIASTVPFIGLLGTVFGILDAFGGFIGSTASHLGFVAWIISESLAPTAMSLAIAIVAAWAHEYLGDRLEILDLEMENTVSELIGYLRLHCSFREQAAVHSGALTLKCEVAQRPVWEAEYDGQRVLIFLYGVFVLYVLYLFASGLVLHFAQPSNWIS